MNRRVLLGIGGLIVLLAALSSVEAVRLIGAYRNLSRARETFTTVQNELLNGDTLATISTAQIGQTQMQMLDAQRRLHRAAAVVGDDPLLAIAARVPVLGRQATATRAVAALGADLGDAGVDATSILNLLQQARDDRSTSALEKIEPTLTAMQPAVARIDRNVQDVHRLRGQIPSGRLLGPLSRAVATLDRQLPRADAALAGYRETLAAVPVALGYSGPRTYLVLARDSSELIGSGGYDMAYGLITVDHGKLTRVLFNDTARLYAGDWPPPDPQNYVQPPPALTKYLLGSWPMSLADVSWWLDFPTSAQQAIQIYHVNSGDQTPIDGVIGLDSYALEDFMRLTGPLTIQQFNVTVTADDVLRQELVIGTPQTPRTDGLNARDFKSLLASQLFAQLQQLPAARWPQLASTLRALVQNRYTALYDTDPALEQEYDRLDAAGKIPEAAGEDFLMVADASVGHSKMNLMVQRTVSLDVTLDAQGSATDQLSLTYATPFQVWVQKDPELAAVFEAPSKHFGDYLRVLVPSDADLLGLTYGGKTLQNNEPVTTEAAHREFATVMSLGEDRSITIAIRSQIPHAASESGATMAYRLLLLKQPGTQGGPASVTVHPPTGWVVQSAAVDGRAAAAPGGVVQTDLSQDRRVSVLLTRAG